MGCIVLDEDSSSGGFWSRWRHRRGRSPIEEAVAQSLMTVHFQPIVDLHDGSILAYEALLRSKTPNFNSPVTMFEAAVKVDCVGALGRLARKIAVETCEEWPLFINIHPQEFDEKWLVQPNDPIFCHGRTVHLEITESVPLSHFEFCNSVLKEIRGKGINLAIDDLGAGFSNLKYISDLSPEIVKIDRELVKGLGPKSRGIELVRHIVAMCQAMGAKVVAEGIETKDELTAVQSVGVHFGQGYLLARPAFPPPPVPWAEILARPSGYSA
jgi:EAL domain-containing protein (putative c-di-GMP-specific phosphodiesterase class I)